VFGDPDDGSGFPGVLNNRSITFCHPLDNICSGGILILPAHLTYGIEVSLFSRHISYKDSDWQLCLGCRRCCCFRGFPPLNRLHLTDGCFLSMKENTYKNIFTRNSSNWDAMVLFCFVYFQYRYRRPDQKADGEGIEYLIGKTNKTVSATLEMKLRCKSSPKRPIESPLHESSSEHTYKVPKELYWMSSEIIQGEVVKVTPVLRTESDRCDATNEHVF